MAIVPIDIGDSPNDRTGDVLRVAGTKINDNFAYLDGLVGGVIEDAETAATTAQGAAINAADSAASANTYAAAAMAAADSVVPAAASLVPISDEIEIVADNIAAVIAASTAAPTRISGTTKTLLITDVALASDNAGATTITIPPHSSVAFPTGAFLPVVQDAAGQITVAAGVGVTLRAANGAKSRTQYSVLYIWQTAQDVWNIGGDVTV